MQKVLTQFCMLCVHLVWMITVLGSRFALNDGEVTYQCRFLRTNTYQRNHEAGRIVVNEFGTKAVPDPCQSIFKRSENRPTNYYKAHCIVLFTKHTVQVITYESPRVQRWLAKLYRFQPEPSNIIIVYQYNTTYNTMQYNIIMSVKSI